MDVVIFSEHLLAPFIAEGDLGVYSAESVLAVIEVKSVANKKRVSQCDKATKDLRDRIYNPEANVYQESTGMPLTAYLDFGRVNWLY